jgi:hypothetical protein
MASDFPCAREGSSGLPRVLLSRVCGASREAWPRNFAGRGVSRGVMPVSTVLVLASVMAAEPPALPLRRLRLYETGVGYFERRGSVSPSAPLALPLPSSHLDDALKSLVVLEATGGVRIQGMEWGSSVSEGMARAMAGLPSEPEAPLSYADLLASLKGSRVQVQTRGGKVRGRLVDLEGPFFLAPERRSPSSLEPASDDPAPHGEPHYTLILLDEEGAVRRIKTDAVQAVRVLDGDTAARLDVAATALSDQSARQTSEVKVQVNAPGRLGLGYVSEAPVWRTTYRVVMSAEPGDGQLQAWALVHNDTDEDWRGVTVELANGRPASFLHPLAAPRYATRELVGPPDDLTTVPQLANETPDSMWGDFGETAGYGGLGLVGTGRGGGGYGEGTIGLGNTGVIGRGGGAGELGDLAELAQAGGSESGALFLYRVTDPVDLRAHHSSLLPIVQQDIEVESITFFGASDGEGLSAARVVNTTSQTLPPGAVSFFADGGFVGESLLDRIKPGERRFVAYGAELDVELERDREALGEETRWLEHRQGAIVERYVLESQIRLWLHNRSGRAQRVYVALDVPRSAELRGDEAVELDFDLATSTPLAVTRVEPGGRVEHVLHAKSTEHRSHEALGVRVLAELRERAGLPAAQREVLDRAIEHARRGEALAGEVAAAERAIERLEGDLVRIREDLAALGKARVRSRARNTVTRELVSKARRIDELRVEVGTLQEESRKAEAAKVAALGGLERPAAAR